MLIKVKSKEKEKKNECKGKRKKGKMKRERNKSNSYFLNSFDQGNKTEFEKIDLSTNYFTLYNNLFFLHRVYCLLKIRT